MTFFFYDLFYMLPLGIAMILSALGLDLGKNISFVGAGTTVMTPAAGCIACSIFIILILVLRHSGKKERVLIGGVLLVATASLFWILGEEKRTLLFEKYNWLIAIFIISIIAIVIGRMAESIIWVKLAVSALLIADISYMMVKGCILPKGTVGICLAVILIYAMEMIQRFWNKSGYTELKAHVAHIAPVLIAFVMLVSMVPTPDETFDWRLAKNIWRATVTEYKRIVAMITSAGEEYEYIGFTESGEVKGAISGGNGREALFISSDNNSFDRLYMGGITYEIFNGHGWETELSKEESNREFDFIETKTAISKYGTGYEREYIKADNITVESRLYNTKHVFLPAKTNMQSANTELPGYKESDSKILTGTRLRYGDSYRINYWQTNFANPELILIADNAEAITEDEWDEVLRKNGIASNDQNDYAYYLEYRDGIYEKYGGNRTLKMEEALEVSQLSLEVKDIVRTIIENAQLVEPEQVEMAYESDGDDNMSGGADPVAMAYESDGDYEKLKALSEYLQTMTYTKAPNALPADIDDASGFLDYFLLESQKGFCVHYATAFTLLARELGYPARYVQGYYVKRTKGGETLVTEDSAHSWAEVYFDNFGWVIFEATPGYTVSRGWKVQGKADASREIRLNPLEVELDTSDISTDELPQEEEEKKTIHISYFIIPILCALFFGIMYLFVSRIAAENRYRKMDDTGKVRMIISRNMRILKLMGYRLGEADTIEEFGRKIAENEALSKALSFLDLYEKLLYSDGSICSEDVINTEKEYEILKNSLRAKGFRYRFYLV